MKLQYKTIEYDIEEGLVYLKRLFKKVKSRTLDEEEFCYAMQHVLSHLNFSVNARHLSRERVSKLTQSQYENLTCFPKKLVKHRKFSYRKS